MTVLNIQNRLTPYRQRGFIPLKIRRDKNLIVFFYIYLQVVHEILENSFKGGKKVK